MNENEAEKKAYALGIIGPHFGVNFNDDDIDPQQMAQLSEIASDAILDEPKTEVGKSMKEIIEKEKADKEGEYNKGFNFHKDLNMNKITPATVFLLQLLAKYAERIVANDEKVEGEMLCELIVKFNELDYPTGYVLRPFNIIVPQIQKLGAVLKGQVDHREDEIKAMAVGIKHPKYNNLTPHIASFKQLDESIKKLQETFGFTEEDYRGK